MEGARRKGAVGVACGQGARAGLSGQTQVSLRVVARDGFDTYRWSTGHVYACCHLSSQSESKMAHAHTHTHTHTLATQSRQSFFTYATVQDQSEEIVGLERQIASLRLSIGREPPAEVAEWKSPAHIVTEMLVAKCMLYSVCRA